MADLGPVAWPPEPIRTERLLLREPEARDRAASIELLSSPEVGTYLGGPRPRDELEREMPGAPERHPGRSRRPVELMLTETLHCHVSRTRKPAAN